MLVFVLECKVDVAPALDCCRTVGCSAFSLGSDDDVASGLDEELKEKRNKKTIMS